MSTQASKSILARALATENITVEHSPNAQTAKFDIANRVLTLPIWKDMSDSLYDMFVGHEVGHALYTPFSEDDLDSKGPWFKKAEQIGGTMNAPYVQGLINAVEDSRIERLMKEKFPGLRRDFVRGYKELMEMDFFGVAERDIADFDFADRINLHTKVGISANVPFTDKEMELVKMVENTQSFEDVLDVVEKIYKFIDGQYEDLPEDGNGVGQSSNDNQDDRNQQGQSSSDGDDDSDGNNISTVQSKQSTNDNPITDGGMGKNNKPKREMVTQKNFEEKAKSDLVDHDASFSNHYVLPDPILKNIILPYKAFISDIETAFNKYKELQPTYASKDEDTFKTLLNKSKPLVSTLVKQFEMRKAADVSKRTSISRSGQVDCNRIFKYKVSDDIFARYATVADGKNHGLVMYVDWSASMSVTTEDVVNQIVILTQFCRQVGIPFDVYFFTSYRSVLNPHIGSSFDDDGYGYGDEENDISANHAQWKNGKSMQENRKHSSQEGYPDDHDRFEYSVHGDRFALVHVLSSSMTSRQYANALKYFHLLAQATSGTSHFHIPPNYFQGNTPLDSTILCAMKMVPEFREKHKVQIVNTIFLTDGQSGHHFFRTQSWGNPHISVRTAWSKKQYKIKVNDSAHTYCETDHMLEIFKDVTNSAVIGFYINNRNSCHYFVRSTDAKTYKKQNFVEVSKSTENNSWNYSTNKRTSNTVNVHGYDRLFVIPSSTRISDVHDHLDSLSNEASVAKIRNAFIKSVDSRNSSRSFLNRFADVIAVA